jgi:hypothetical protein
VTHPTESSRLLDVLRRAGEEFDRRRLPWALVGGLAVVLDLLFASSGLEHDVCEAAERLEILPGVSVPVARAGHLVAMKLLSRADHRLQDEIDLRNLAVVLTTEDIELARLAVARIEAVGANRGRELVADLVRYLAAFASGPR